MNDYRTVNIWTLEGLKEAERLHAMGWEIVRSGLFTIVWRSPRKPLTHYMVKPQHAACGMHPRDDDDAPASTSPEDVTCAQCREYVQTHERRSV